MLYCRCPLLHGVAGRQQGKEQHQGAEEHLPSEYQGRQPEAKRGKKDRWYLVACADGIQGEGDECYKAVGGSEVAADTAFPTFSLVEMHAGGSSGPTARRAPGVRP